LNVFRKQKLLAREESFNSRKRKKLNAEVIWREIKILRRSIRKKGNRRTGKKINREASEEMVI